MTRFISAAMAVIAGLLAASSASAATLVTLDADFESPTFTIGNIANDPNATGQGGWGGYNAILDENNACCLRARITDERAHTGTQSMRTTSDTRVIQKALDANPQPGDPNYLSSGGEYPFHSGGFTLHPSFDWWVQAFVWINPGGAAGMTLVNGLGGCPLLHIGNLGFGNDPGEPYANSCLANSGDQPSLGSAAYGQWLLLEIVHTTAMNGTPNGAAIEFRISGVGIDRTIQLAPYSGAGSGNPAYLGLAGDAYWDDVRAGYGDVPAPVPVPAAAWLMVSALGTLAAHWRRRA
jgi:hypothetical protein